MSSYKEFMSSKYKKNVYSSERFCLTKVEIVKVAAPMLVWKHSDLRTFADTRGNGDHSG